MKKNKKCTEFLNHLRQIPIVLVATEKAGLSRNTVYRWRREDTEFAEAMDQALKDGEDLINDMSESQLLSLIKEKNYRAISFWLKHRNPKFKERVEVTTKIVSEALSPEQESIVREALKLATTQSNDAHNITGTGRANDSGQEG